MLYGFAKRISKINMDVMRFDKPTLVLANHPNSFFDAIILTVTCHQNLYYLVRGDLFEKPWANKWLRKLHMLPIYKSSLNDKSWIIKNEATYEEVFRLFQEGKHVVLFPEGNSHNDWYLQKLQKGGISNIIKKVHAKNINIDIQVLNITYNSFYYLPKSIIVTAEKPFSSKNFNSPNHIFNFDAFLEYVTQQMQSSFKRPEATYISNHIIRIIVLAIPAFIGWMLHGWYYQAIKRFVWRKTKGIRFFDSVALGIYVISYPILVLLYGLIIYVLVDDIALALTSLILLPFTAFCYIQVKPLKFGNRKGAFKFQNERPLPIN